MLLPYHVRLAAKSLWRDPGVTLIMLVAIALGNGVWSLAVSQYARFQGWGIRLPATLHQVEILRPHDANAAFADGAAANPYLTPVAIMQRTQQSVPEWRRLGGSRVPARASAGIRGEVLVRGPGSVAPLVRIARFTNAAFFAMFERRFAVGAPWPEAADAEGASSPASVVLSLATGRRLFPRGDALGRTVTVEGRPFRVVGVLGQYQPLNAPWQLLIVGGHEDALFLPMAELDRLGVYPDQPIFRSPVGRGRASLLASDALVVNSWVDLPTPAHVAAYKADLDRLLGPGRWVLRDLAAWRPAFAMPKSQIAFFSFLGFVVLVGGGFNLSRWLFTRGLVRAEELGIYRALGAPRSSLFARTAAEGMLVAGPAALLGPVVALPIVWVFNRYVDVVDMPLELGSVAIALSIVPPLLVCAVGTLYPAWRLARTRPTLSMGRS